MKPTDPQHNAFTTPRRVKSGCQHIGGCGCETPYHLRESTPAERAFEARAFAPPVPQITTDT